jgi:sugar/nucleoside kinase (ribokinase family)
MGDPGPTGASHDLLVVGEINPDIVVVDPDRHPSFGQVERIVSRIDVTIGSSSVITACGCARLGLSVAIVGVVGDDATGRLIIAAMNDRGLETSAVRIDPDRPTGASVILSDGQDRAIMTALGTIGTVTAADVLPYLGGARHLHVGSWFLQRDLWADGRSLLAAARSAGLTTSIDPNWDPEADWDRGLRGLLPLVDVFLPNEAEVAHIAGIDDPRQAAADLARLGPLVVVKCGPAGAFAVSTDGTLHETAAYRVEVVDTTGAGDSFDAGFLVAWLDRATIPDALRMAVVCGALSTMAVGGVEGQPALGAAAAAVAGWT